MPGGGLRQGLCCSQVSSTSPRSNPVHPTDARCCLRGLVYHKRVVHGIGATAKVRLSLLCAGWHAGMLASWLLAWNCSFISSLAGWAALSCLSCLSALQFECETCGKTFTAVQGLNYHVKRNVCQRKVQRLIQTRLEAKPIPIQTG